MVKNTHILLHGCAKLLAKNLAVSTPLANRANRARRRARLKSIANVYLHFLDSESKKNP